MRLALQYIIISGVALALSSVSFSLLAQDRCGTIQYSRTLYANPVLQKTAFEKWLGEQKTSFSLGRAAREQAAPYQIPVVVHIIHNGEPIGVGTNITDEQVLSQLRVLNEDFRRENADAANTPQVFLDDAGSLDIEFVLAKRDPDGLATDGIVRINGGRSSWTMNDNYALKSTSYWPAEQYLNIWVCNLTDSFVGYAQFPESNLQGHENSSNNRLTDGVVIWHKAFGSDDDGAFNLDPAFNKGRTATHETGHFFGLHHIWGDDAGCSGTDYVTDTPNQGANTDGCATHPKTDGCGQVIMFQNFLDYTDDDCMNLFTNGQVNRMIAVIENSPRRNTLLSSPALQEPAPLPDDLGIRAIVFPDASVCSNLITPVIELRNYGSNVITSGRVRFILDGTVQETVDFSLALDPLASTEVSFSTLSVPSGNHTITFQVLLTNGGTDLGSYNDERSSTVIVPAFANAPFAETFNVLPPGWIIHNPDGQVTWQPVAAPNDQAGNKALKLNYFDYEDKVGEIDMFLSPVIDLSTAATARLSFEVAHARFKSSNDRLKVIVMTDCEDINQGTVVYNKAGDSLKSVPETTSPFTPSGANQWRKELVNLSAFAGAGKVQIAFVGINDWGNNIYLDDVALFTEKTNDAALIRLVSPSLVTCENEVVPRILILNTGSEILEDLNVVYSINGGSSATVAFTGLNLPFSGEKEIDLPPLSLPASDNTILIRVENPNGFSDYNPADNEKSFNVVINQARDRIPLRENFESDFTSAWTSVNPNGGTNWETTATNYGQSLYFNAYDNNLSGDEAWLVSPVLDFSGTAEASMAFDLSYAARATGTGRLVILGSRDCGNTYEEIPYNFPTGEIVEGRWIPGTDEDWNNNIPVNLNSFAGEENVRIAFVVRNQEGNNLYLDNIEFFVSQEPASVEFSELYTVYGYDLTHPELTDLKIAFNLPERQNVRFSIINATGQMETDGLLTDVLNQTFPLQLPQRLPPGIYFIRVQIGGKFFSSKILVF
ncbi:MAG: choice-of-anchor J domain-containing protein [Chryseosolibacter sp.]